VCDTSMFIGSKAHQYIISALKVYAQLSCMCELKLSSEILLSELEKLNFDCCSMLTCLVTLWVRNQHPSPFFSFGFVLSYFTQSVACTLVLLHWTCDEEAVGSTYIVT